MNPRPLVTFGCSVIGAIVIVMGLYSYVRGKGKDPAAKLSSNDEKLCASVQPSCQRLQVILLQIVCKRLLQRIFYHRNSIFHSMLKEKVYVHVLYNKYCYQMVLLDLFIFPSL